MDSLACADAGALTKRFKQLSVNSNSQRGLLSIPRELRNEIFGHLLRAGSLAFLRTSRQVHDEGKELLFHEGVFRLKIGGHATYRTLLPANGHLIQNYHFLIFIGDDMELRHVPMGELLADFLRPDDISPKTTCIIRFIPSRFDDDIDIWLSVMNQTYPWVDQVQDLARLTTFTRVVFEFSPLPWPEQAEAYEGYGLDIMESKYRWNNFFKDMMRRLGPGRNEVIEDENGEVTERRIVFHPRLYPISFAAEKGMVLGEV